MLLEKQMACCMPRTSLNILEILYFVLSRETTWLDYFTTNKVPVLLTSNKGKANKPGRGIIDQWLLRRFFTRVGYFTELLNTFYIRLRLTDQSAEFCKMSNYHFVACKRRVWQGQAHFYPGSMLVLHSLWQVTGDNDKTFPFSHQRLEDSGRQTDEVTGNEFQLQTGHRHISYRGDEKHKSEIRRQALTLNETFPRNPATMKLDAIFLVCYWRKISYVRYRYRAKNVQS